VGCYSGDVSTCVTPSVCDTVNRECALQCSSDEYIWACEGRGWYCDPDRDNLCVECLEDEHCAAFAHCDGNVGRCVEDDGRPLCAPCDADDQCGDAGDLCVNLDHGFMLDEQVCGLDCSAGLTCPPGTSCQEVGEPVRGAQCLPHNTVMELSTCKAFIDTSEFVECQSSWDCGLTRNRDAICSDVGLSAGHCTMLCDPAVQDQCPGIQAVCQPIEGDAPRCGPPV
jgi:hypothetical protein